MRVSDKTKTDAALLAAVKARMQQLIDADLCITKESVSTEEAIRRCKANGLVGKEKLFKYRRVSKTNLYNLFRGASLLLLTVLFFLFVSKDSKIY